MLNALRQSGLRPMMVDQYSELYEAFRWHVPKDFNLATACCLRWAQLPGHDRRTALLWHDEHEQPKALSYGELARAMSQLAHGLSRLGVIPGDRVVIVMSEPGDILIAMLACWVSRAVAVPLAPDTSAEQLLPRLKQSRSQVALIDAKTKPQALVAIERCSRIKHVVGVDVYDGRVMNWRGLTARQPDSYEPSDSLPSDPALLVWPQKPSPDLPDQAALVLAHQGLFGQLPGFVALNNWFPDNARQLLCTLPIWSEAGLLGAILPTLMFGQTVRLEPTLPAPEDLSRRVSHVVTSSSALVHRLKNVEPSEDVFSTELNGLAVLDFALHDGWRSKALKSYGIEPNLGIFVSGCGLVMGQSHQKWSNSTPDSMRVMPGHLVRFEPITQQTDQCVSANIQISRTDLSGHTDPAQFTQIWPLKDTLDLSITLPQWWQPGICVRQTSPIDVEPLGDSSEFITLTHHSVSLSTLEQIVLLDDEVRWSQVITSVARKQPEDIIELWILIDIVRPENAADSSWRASVQQRITQRILTTIGESPDNLSLRVGIVKELAKHELGSAKRTQWSSRQDIARIDFL